MPRLSRTNSRRHGGGGEAEVKTFSGAGSIKALAREVDAAGVRNLLLVTDPGVVRAGIVERVRDVVGGHIAAVFDAVPQDSGLGVVAGAAAAGRSAGADAVLSVGGGSVIDTGKGVALMLGLDLPATALPGINHLRGRPAFHAVVPTTAGTGSEATDVAVLRDERTTVKVFVVD
ncbi:MAG: iron-containing alcohol dehydrogenase, partial [Planctomycetes bacterium]|nr:iron-containing alcohol dehydrogenase [Planctomycetota bacterium]